MPAHHRIFDLSYSTNEAAPDSLPERKTVFDIACTGESRERFIVELQKAKQNFFKDRIIRHRILLLGKQTKHGNV